MTELLTIKEASFWASNHLKKNVTSSNISYLIQYGKVPKYKENGATAIRKTDLINYYENFNGHRETNWREKLGEDLNWVLSFDNLKEKDTTKHIHRLHPYKGKFIPQLVEYFPSPEYKIKVRQKEIIEKDYTPIKEREFAIIFDELQRKYQLKIKQDKTQTFLEKWYLEPVKKEIDFTFEQLKSIENPSIKKIMTIVLSRTIRSCSATTHADLATLKEPVTKTYYCRKHGKICKPLFSILSWWERYSKDTVQRLCEFDKLRTNTYQKCLQGDARNINIFDALSRKSPEFGEFVKAKKIKGIFSSPPYVGLIDYHEQHAYAYDLFGFKRNDELEIGPFLRGKVR